MKNTPDTLLPKPGSLIFSGVFEESSKRGVKSTREQWQRKLVVVLRKVRPA
jgi:hypothetical protein